MLERVMLLFHILSVTEEKYAFKKIEPIGERNSFLLKQILNVCQNVKFDNKMDMIIVATHCTKFWI